MDTHFCPDYVRTLCGAPALYDPRNWVGPGLEGKVNCHECYRQMETKGYEVTAPGTVPQESVSEPIKVQPLVNEHYAQMRVSLATPVVPFKPRKRK